MVVADEGPRALMLNLPGMRADQAARSPAPGAPAHVAGLWRSLTSRSSQSRSCSSLSLSLLHLTALVQAKAANTLSVHSLETWRNTRPKQTDYVFDTPKL